MIYNEYGNNIIEYIRHYTQLPNGWAVCRLDQVADVLDKLRKPINSNERNLRIKGKQIDRLYPYYGATGQVGLIDDYIVDGHYLLLGEDGAPFLDKNAIKAYSISGKSWVNNHAHILSPKIDFEFLQYSLNQIDYSEYVNGSTRLKLTQTDMRSIRLMLPPLSEQKLIKAKIQTLFSQLDMIMGAYKLSIIISKVAKIISILSIIRFCSEGGGRYIGINKNLSRIRLCKPVVCVCINLIAPV